MFLATQMKTKYLKKIEKNLPKKNSLTSGP